MLASTGVKTRAPEVNASPAADVLEDRLARPSTSTATATEGQAGEPELGEQGGVAMIWGELAQRPRMSIV